MRCASEGGGDRTALVRYVCHLALGSLVRACWLDGLRCRPNASTDAKAETGNMPVSRRLDLVTLKTRCRRTLGEKDSSGRDGGMPRPEPNSTDTHVGAVDEPQKPQESQHLCSLLLLAFALPVAGSVVRKMVVFLLKRRDSLHGMTRQSHMNRPS